MAGPNEREQMDTLLAYMTGLVNQELPVGSPASTVESASAAYFGITVSPHEYFDQTESSPFSLEGREWKAESRILHHDGRMTAEEESRETKQEQEEGRHRPRFLDYRVMKVKPLSADRILASHRRDLATARSRRGLPLGICAAISCEPPVHFGLGSTCGRRTAL